MKITLITLLALTSGFQAFAKEPSYSKESFCSDRKDERFVKDLTMNSSNLMAFRNHGGIGNRGVCWWHSRFQRNALYLTLYKPNLPRPTDEEAKEIVKQIREAKDIVIIPGFRNFTEFSDIHEAQIQRELEKWQKGDGVIRFAWIKGLSGTSSVAADQMKATMDEMYDDVEVKKNIAYNKLQIPGIDAHAWLVVHMEKVQGGYNLEVLDSNSPRSTEIYRYHEGDTEFNYHGFFKFTPYLEKTDEMDKIKKVIERRCNESISENLTNK